MKTVLHFIFLLLTYMWTAFCTASELDKELFASLPEEVVTLSNEESFLIGGTISPLSGQPCVSQTDLVAKGAQDLLLTRHYIAPFLQVSFDKDPKEHAYQMHLYLQKKHRGWVCYPQLRFQYTPLKTIRLPTSSGAILDFSILPNGKTTLVGPTYGISNWTHDTPSAKHDPRNIKIIQENSKIIVCLPNGLKRIYRNGPPGLLEKEILPNGKILKYSYDGNKLNHIDSLDPKERYVYATLTDQMSGHNQLFTTQSGQKATYTFKTDVKNHKLNRKGDKLQLPTMITLLSSAKTPLYTNEKAEYSETFLLESHDGKDHFFKCTYAPCQGGETPHFRVKTLSFPVGPKDKWEIVYTFEYDPPIAGKQGGSTTVKCCDGTKTIYVFNKNLLIEAIQYYDQKNNLKKERLFSWDSQQRLTSVSWVDGQKKLHSRTSYSYDNFGNPLVESFEGTLMGDGQLQKISIKRTYSQDGRHLVLTEDHEEGPSYVFQYLPGTNLATTKLTKDGNKIIQREFWNYDDCNNLVKQITDNGSKPEQNDLTDVSERQITTYYLRQQHPFLHMPEWIEETYLVQGKETLLKKTQLTYDKNGNVSQENVYDSLGNHAYTIHKAYNDRGDVTSETNALEQLATHNYNDKGLCVASSNFSQRLHTKKNYDLQGRLTRTDENTHTTQYAYDKNNRCIEKSDFLGNAFQYSYDPICNKTTKTEGPAISDLEGHATRVMTTSTYDPFGRKITETDPNGFTTSYVYNAYGEPTEITHPDGSKEQLRYTKLGKLQCHVDEEGQSIVYTYDVLGRLTSKTYLKRDNSVIATETWNYSGFHLVQETDKEGFSTKYSYDGAGRKIREDSVTGKITTFSYDSLGRLETVTKHNGEQTLKIVYTRDLLDRVVKQQQTDLQENVLHEVSYEYDDDGNRSKILRKVNNQISEETYAYDPFGRLVAHMEPCGATTTTQYDEKNLNPLGQRILSKRTTLPQGTILVEAFDSYDRQVAMTLTDSSKKPLMAYTMTYSPTGHLIEQKNQIDEKNFQVQRLTYTPRNQISTLTKGYGTPEALTHTFTYTPTGDMASQTLPQGVTLTYAYDGSHYLSSVNSSDKQIQQTFTYNRLGHLLKAVDAVQNTAFTRTLDPSGNILSELFSNGMTLEKTYDSLDRPLTMEMGPAGKVAYTYDPVYLRTIMRRMPKGTYTQRFSYDLDGNVTCETGDLCKIIRTHDLNGRVASIKSSFFSETYSYDLAGNLIARGKSTYTYDPLDQLLTEPNHTYGYDSHYNRVQIDGKEASHNNLNQVLVQSDVTCTYDRNGNLATKKSPTDTLEMAFDLLGRLTHVQKTNERTQYSYDALGRRLTKTTYSNNKEVAREDYLYDGHEEIGCFVRKNPKQLRIFGNKTPIALELEGDLFACACDPQGNVRSILDPFTQIITHYPTTAFGEATKESHPFNPWSFASKRLDPETNFIYFGKRYYDPELARWLSPDPASLFDHNNLYHYLYNNPYRFYDPDGQTAFALSLAWNFGPSGLVFLTPGVGWALAVIALGTWAGYEIYQANKIHHQQQAYNDYMNQMMMNQSHEATQSSDNKSKKPKQKSEKGENGRVNEHTPDQEALSDLVKTSTRGKKAISDSDADTLIEWGKEYNFPNTRDDRNEPLHWKGGRHIHIGNEHIRVQN